MSPTSYQAAPPRDKDMKDTAARARRQPLRNRHIQGFSAASAVALRPTPRVVVGTVSVTSSAGGETQGCGRP
jgi:hypothetical protein